MTFEEVLTQAIAMLQRLGRVEDASALAEQLLEHSVPIQDEDTRRRLFDSSATSPCIAMPLERELAAAHYQQALALAEELGMRPLQAHCHRGLGTLYATTGQREQARAALAAAIDDVSRPWTMTFWLPETEAALAQVEGR